MTVALDLRPLLLLDIDGSLSPTTAEPVHEHPVIRVQLFPGGMHFRADLVDLLLGLHPDRVEVAWLTSWEEQAATDLAPALGLPQWPTHTRRGAPAGFSDWWKERVVAGYLAAGRRVIWVDDEIAFRADLDWLHARWPDQLTALSPDSSLAVDTPVLRAALS